MSRMSILNYIPSKELQRQFYHTAPCSNRASTTASNMPFLHFNSLKFAHKAMGCSGLAREYNQPSSQAHHTTED